MSKNLVVVPNFKDDPNREDRVFVKNSIFLWEQWCKKFDHNFLVIEEPVCDFDSLRVEMQKMWIMDILDHNEVNYDQVLVVDYDTYPIPNCPDIFEVAGGEFGAALDNGFGPQLNRSMTMYREHWFPHITTQMLNWDNYLNGGLLVYNKKHKVLFKAIQDFYYKHFKEVDIVNKDMENSQTIMNYLLIDLGIKIKVLPRSFNVLDFHMERFLMNSYLDDRGRLVDRDKNIMDCINVFHITNGSIRDQASEYLKFAIWKLQ